jgi:hypothetical protein
MKCVDLPTLAIGSGLVERMIVHGEEITHAELLRLIQRQPGIVMRLPDISCSCANTRFVEVWNHFYCQHCGKRWQYPDMRFRWCMDHDEIVGIKQHHWTVTSSAHATCIQARETTFRERYAEIFRRKGQTYNRAYRPKTHLITFGGEENQFIPHYDVASLNVLTRDGKDRVSFTQSDIRGETPHDPDEIAAFETTLGPPPILSPEEVAQHFATVRSRGRCDEDKIQLSLDILCRYYQHLPIAAARYTKRFTTEPLAGLIQTALVELHQAFRGFIARKNGLGFEEYALARMIEAIEQEYFQAEIEFFEKWFDPYSFFPGDFHRVLSAENIFGTLGALEDFHYDSLFPGVTYPDRLDCLLSPAGNDTAIENEVEIYFLRQMYDRILRRNKMSVERKKVIALRYGLEQDEIFGIEGHYPEVALDDPIRSYTEVAKLLNVTNPNIRSLEYHALYYFRRNFMWIASGVLGYQHFY